MEHTVRNVSKPGYLVLATCKKEIGHSRANSTKTGWYLVLFSSYITVASPESHDVLNHRQLDCLLYALSILTTKKTPNLRITGPVCGDASDPQRISTTDSVSMSLLPDTQTCRLHMCRECRERFPRDQRHGNR